MIEFEIALMSFKKGFQGKDISDKIKNFKEYFPRIGLSIYDGINSIFSAGRSSLNNAEKVIENIRLINKQKVPFILVMNNGLIYNHLPLEKITFEKDVLDFLEKNGREMGVVNGVVIGHDDFLNYILEFNPSLKTICSTIQFLDITKFTSYEDKFQKYDLVVPLNQHTSYNFLKQFKDYSDKMLLFLNLPCYESDLLKCYKHYANIELSILSNFGLIPEYVKFIKKSDSITNPFELILEENRTLNRIIPSQCKPIKCLNVEGNSNALYLRSDLSNLFKMGVNKFKIPRAFVLYEPDFRMVLSYIQREI